MSFVAVHRGTSLTLVSDRLVLSADEAQHFESAQALAIALETLRDGEAQRIDAAYRAARAAGHAEGHAEGLREAQREGAEQLADALTAVAAQARTEHAALRDAVLTLSLLVVRRMAASLSHADVLTALAQQAFDRLVAEQAQPGGAESPTACVVRLHGSLLADVRARVEQRGALPLTIEWRADDALAPMDCMIDTPSGRLLAGLEAQLERVQAVLRESAQARRSVLAGVTEA